MKEKKGILRWGGEKKIKNLSAWSGLRKEEKKKEKKKQHTSSKNNNNNNHKRTSCNLDLQQMFQILFVLDNDLIYKILFDLIYHFHDVSHQLLYSMLDLVLKNISYN